MGTSPKPSSICGFRRRPRGGSSCGRVRNAVSKWAHPETAGPGASEHCYAGRASRQQLDVDPCPGRRRHGQPGKQLDAWRGADAHEDVHRTFCSPAPANRPGQQCRWSSLSDQGAHEFGLPLNEWLKFNNDEHPANTYNQQYLPEQVPHALVRRVTCPLTRYAHVAGRGRTRSDHGRRRGC